MTKRERLIRIFKGAETDRPALKLWNLHKNQTLLHPDYKPVYELGLSVTELFDGGSCPFDCVFGAGIRTAKEKRPVSTEWEDVISTLDTGIKKLTQIDRVSLVKKPGYAMEHFVKDADELAAVLDMPYAPHPADLTNYTEAVARVGDDGVALYNLPHPAYALYGLMGSETLALMSVVAPELLERAVALFSERLITHVKALLDLGLANVSDFTAFGWVGPELFIPPLMSPAHFDTFCFGPDKRLIDVIKNAGGCVWVHCHGKMKHFIDRFARMGVDVLNPVEPPPMGDVSLKGAFEIADGRMALEGNIEIGEIMTATPETVRYLVDRALAERGDRFILGLTTGYMEVPVPPKRFIDNELLYLNYGYERLTAMSRG